MGYKEMKLEKGEAQGLYDLWNAGMTKKATKKSTAKKPVAKKKTTAKKK